MTCSPHKWGLRQGYLVSNIFINGMVKELNERLTGKRTILRTSRLRWLQEVNQLLFADDSALADDSVEKLNRILSGFEKVS